MSKVRMYSMRPIATHKQKLNHSHATKIPSSFSCTVVYTRQLFLLLSCLYVRHTEQVGTRQICLFSFSGRNTDLFQFEDLFKKHLGDIYDFRLVFDTLSLFLSFFKSILRILNTYVSAKYIFWNLVVLFFEIWNILYYNLYIDFELQNHQEMKWKITEKII